LWLSAESTLVSEASGNQNQNSHLLAYLSVAFDMNAAYLGCRNPVSTIHRRTASVQIPAKSTKSQRFGLLYAPKILISDVIRSTARRLQLLVFSKTAAVGARCMVIVAGVEWRH
jgi:hypothetical protein